ncbi:protein-export chaperone SecB [Gilvimarinus xylanilyticus]|uniref:Protein-export protein SecB n=1 Tax=Gilvimarinus xylanilyticus TaxID=2944139 RepID=A0A9X2HWC8_9GAMM|nr:protein-export chaperone SecB [Gilvimarinus xylanilyticus]MCP8899613.1 protein-export chaperone SecB [Gilvimarinus xylanilyticus]
MSEENTQEPQAQANGQDQDKAAPSFAVRRIYLKDLSFETPMGLEAFNQKQPPKIEQELNVQVNRVDENHHEVVLLLTITAKMEEKVAFLIEVKQAGIFSISGMDKATMAQIINANCPNILFPYARETIDSVLTRGSFAPLMLPPINFDAVFAQAVNSAQQKAADQAQAETDA